jgi:SAM-dependent methyltransferase
MYSHLMKSIAGRTVLEAGCGTGLGTAMLERTAHTIKGTDKLQRNIDFAKAVYPWIEFSTWDLNYPSSLRASIVVCVEAIEHVGNTQNALKHLLASAWDEVWVSVPNGTGKPSPPSNPYHVHEYTPEEMLEMIGDLPVTIRRWDDWNVVNAHTDCDPLMYHIRKR